MRVKEESSARYASLIHAILQQSDRDVGENLIAETLPCPSTPKNELSYQIGLSDHSSGNLYPYPLNHPLHKIFVGIPVGSAYSPQASVRHNVFTNI
jgi:hypothetical protein